MQLMGVTLRFTARPVRRNFPFAGVHPHVEGIWFLCRDEFNIDRISFCGGGLLNRIFHSLDLLHLLLGFLHFRSLNCRAGVEVDFYSDMNVSRGGFVNVVGAASELPWYGHPSPLRVA